MILSSKWRAYNDFKRRAYALLFLCSAYKGNRWLGVGCVVATGLGVSVISRSAFDRLKRYHLSLKDNQAPLTETKGATLYLPQGTEEVSTVEIPGIAMVSNESNDYTPCEELALRKRLLMANAVNGLADNPKYVYKDINGASTAQLSNPVTFAIVKDESPIIQGLRLEIQPYVANVDILLGGSFFKSFDTIIDYPNSRLILQCSEEATAASSCRVLPWCSHNVDLTPHCITMTPPPVTGEQPPQWATTWSLSSTQKWRHVQNHRD